MKNEGSTHSEGSTEKAGFEYNIISRRRLTGFRERRCLWTSGGPIVTSEYKCGEVDFMRSSRSRSSVVVPGLKRCGPGFYVRDVFETACQSLQQLLLLS
jgi:hypothetical protein